MSTCDDDYGSAEDVGEDEDVNVLQGVELEPIATRDRRCHLYNLVPLVLPVLGQCKHKQSGYKSLSTEEKGTHSGFGSGFCTMVVYLSPVCVNSCDCSSSAWKRALNTAVSVSFRTPWRAFRSTRSVSWTPSMYWEAACSKQFPSPADTNHTQRD